MIETIYIEQEAADHPRTRDICERFKEARTVACGRYTEIFNRKAQDYRLQKLKPSLILARKHGRLLLPTPAEYSIGGTENFYFSHLLNCLYDCRYCFLQGMYRSAHYVLFVNYEDFESAIETAATESVAPEQLYFFSGYDSDSLALEPVSSFVAHMLPLFERLSAVRFELRTKSTQVRVLLDRDPVSNCVVAYSLAPASIAAAVEYRAPGTQARLRTLERLGRHGWPLGLRLDPLIATRDYRAHYRELIRQIARCLQPEWIHSVSIGVFRMPQTYFRALERLYPEDSLLAGAYSERNGLTSYSQAVTEEIMDFCISQLRDFLPEEKLFPCTADNPATQLASVSPARSGSKDSTSVFK